MTTYFAPAPERGLLRLTGRDRVAFLHNMTTSHVKRLQPGQGQPAAIVDQRAQVLDWGGVHVDPDGESLWITTAAGRSADVAAWLDKYLITEDVAIANLAAEQPLTFLTGPGAEAIMAQATGVPTAPWTMTHATVAGQPVRVFGTTGFGGPGYLLAAEPQAQDAVATALAAAGAVPAEPETLETARVAAGVPAFGGELGGRTNPWEARLDGAIALDKGCYLGQEVVARLQAYDKVQRLLVGLDVVAGAAIAPGTPLFPAEAPADGTAARPVGEVTSVATGRPGEPPAVLALVKRSHAAAGTAIWIQPADGEPIPAIAAGRPFWEQVLP